jgi:hypothetical protein
MPGRRIADHHPAVGMGDDDDRLTAVEDSTDRGGVICQAWPGSGGGDAGLTAGGQRDRSAGDAAPAQQAGDGRPPPRSVADERAVNEENSHACDGSRMPVCARLAAGQIPELTAPARSQQGNSMLTLHSYQHRFTSRSTGSLMAVRNMPSMQA